MVFERHVPDHYLVDHALKIGAAGAINAQFEVDVGKRAAGVDVLTANTPSMYWRRSPLSNTVTRCVQRWATTSPR